MKEIDETIIGVEVQQTELAAGSTLQGGKYRIVKKLGQGGFGITYLGEQDALKRKVAIKEFFMKDFCNRSETTSNISVASKSSANMVEKFLRKFIKEAQIIAAYDHKGIVKIFDTFEENGTAYYVMEYVGGGSLKEQVSKEKPMGMRRAVKTIKEVGEALSYLHRRSVAHLDVKPANILCREDGSVVLIDFGISKQYDEKSGEQTSSTPIGKSKGFAPLEQYQQGGMVKFSPTSDIYSLGATLFYLLQGEVPPEASMVNEEGLPKMREAVSRNVEEAIVAAMQPRRKDRPQTMEEFIEMLSTTKTESGNTKKQDIENHNSLTKTKVAIISVVLILCAMIYFVYDKSGNHNTTNIENKTDNNPELTCDIGLSVYWGTVNARDSVGNTGLYTYNQAADIIQRTYGKGWRLPTDVELKELKEKCTWKWNSTQKGYDVKGPNGVSLFLPADGYMENNKLNNVGVYGNYWSATSTGNEYANIMYFSNSDGVNFDYNDKTVCLSIRPVKDRKKPGEKR